MVWCYPAGTVCHHIDLGKQPKGLHRNDNQTNTAVLVQTSASHKPKGLPFAGPFQIRRLIKGG